jgi:DNA-binding response OmpR family regulator
MARIVIVDDDPDIVEAVTLFLQKEGHEVSGAFNREEGLTLIKSVDPDLVILDVMMESPDDGIVMAQDLRRDGLDKPILMLTSVSRVTGMSYGRDNELVPVDEFLEKPVDPAVLVQAVAKLLNKR